jgi:excinuclease ABC subunit C
MRQENIPEYRHGFVDVSCWGQRSFYERIAMRENISTELADKIARLPCKPGVYLMKGRDGEVLYVGKAKDLHSRVRSYFQEGNDNARLITRRTGDVEDIAIVVTQSDKEALVLENNFIKQFRPKYNVLFRDDKSFVSIKISLDERWPRPVITRRLGDEGARYFGPYASAKAAKETMRVLENIFPFRKCSMRQCRLAERPCVYGQMGKCLAPCCAEVSEEEYEKLIEEVMMFLDGKCEDLLDELREDMHDASEKLEFERAARLRDRIRAVEETVQKQLAGSSMDKVDRDIFGIESTDKNIWVALLLVREGNIQDALNYRFPARIDTTGGVFRSFLNQFYSSNRFIPDEVLLPMETEDARILADWLSEKKGRKVEVLFPRRGRKRRLVELANRNARGAERIGDSRENRRRLKMESLQEIIGLKKLPRNIECFDISNLGGREAVGSMVVFRDGEPDKSSYRRYKIRNVGGQDDFAMMAEVIRRRYRRVAEKTGKEWEQKMPELVVVDGGKGQLSAAISGMKDVGVEPPDVIGLAKARFERGGGKGERVFLPGHREAFTLPDNTYGFRLLTAVRDEAHRFAISYHRKLRRERSTSSPLMDVKGVGPKIAGRIMERFKTLERVAKASEEELAEVPGVSMRLARLVREELAANRQRGYV